MVYCLPYLHQTFDSLSWSCDHCCHDTCYHPSVEVLTYTAQKERSSPNLECYSRLIVYIYIREFLIGCLDLQLLPNPISKETYGIHWSDSYQRSQHPTVQSTHTLGRRPSGKKKRA